MLKCLSNLCSGDCGKENRKKAIVSLAKRGLIDAWILCLPDCGKTAFNGTGDGPPDTVKNQDGLLLLINGRG
jgi:hypothetical protein